MLTVVSPSLGRFRIYSFMPRDAMHKRGLCRHAVSVCVSGLTEIAGQDNDGQTSRA